MVDETRPAQVFATLLHLMRTHRLTADDATYLELALRRGLPLATNDGALRRAAQASGVELVTTAA